MMDVVDDEGDPGGLKNNTRSVAPPPANMPPGRAAGTTFEGRA